MLSVELIKKMAELVPGFTWDNNKQIICTPGNSFIHVLQFDDYDVFTQEVYPLLLSQCCDELGISLDCIDGEKDCWSWAVYINDMMTEPFLNYPTPTAAREAGIEFVLGE